MAENSCQPLIDFEGSEFGGSWVCVPLPPECQAVGVPACFSGFESPPRGWPSGCKLKWVWGQPDDVDLTRLWEAAGWAPHQQCHQTSPGHSDSKQWFALTSPDRRLLQALPCSSNHLFVTLPWSQGPRDPQYVRLGGPSSWLLGVITSHYSER